MILVYVMDSGWGHKIPLCLFLDCLSNGKWGIFCPPLVEPKVNNHATRFRVCHRFYGLPPKNSFFSPQEQGHNIYVSDLTISYSLLKIAKKYRHRKKKVWIRLMEAVCDVTIKSSHCVGQTCRMPTASLLSQVSQPSHTCSLSPSISLKHNKVC